MRHNAHNTILDRDLSKVIAQPIIEIASPLLKELVNHGTYALVRCASEQSSDHHDANAVILAIYRHIIEMTDALEVLLASACADPMIPLLRSAFEGVLNLEYILEDPREREQRALSWLVFYIEQRIAIYERLDSSTNRGKEFQRHVADDKIASHLPLDQLLPASKEIRTGLEGLLQEPHLAPIAEEIRSSERRRWHQAFDGPPNRAALAERLQLRGVYDMLYRHWSSVSHAEDLSRFIAATPTGEPGIGKIRDPGQLREFSVIAIGLILQATRRTIEHYRPGEDLSQWYTEEVHERYQRLIRLRNQASEKDSKP